MMSEVVAETVWRRLCSRQGCLIASLRDCRSCHYAALTLAIHLASKLSIQYLQDIKQLIY